MRVWIVCRGRYVLTSALRQYAKVVVVRVFVERGWKLKKEAKSQPGDRGPSSGGVGAKGEYDLLVATTGACGVVDASACTAAVGRLEASGAAGEEL
jgi:hypothetical protein